MNNKLLKFYELVIFFFLIKSLSYAEDVSLMGGGSVGKFQFQQKYLSEYTEIYSGYDAMVPFNLEWYGKNKLGISYNRMHIVKRKTANNFGIEATTEGKITVISNLLKLVWVDHLFSTIYWGANVGVGSSLYEGEISLIESTGITTQTITHSTSGSI